jgi:hypothetical protein
MEKKAMRIYFKRCWIAGLLVACFCLPIFAAEQEHVNTGQDFTRPLTRFDLRYQYQSLSGSTEQNHLILRVDKPVPLDGGKSGLLYLRADMPVNYGDAPSTDNPNGDYEFGSGDLFTQLVYVPPVEDSADLPWDAWGYGVGFLWPTASQVQFGAEKYQIFPLVGAKWKKDNWSPGSFFTLLGRYYMDYADYSGGDKRDDIDTLEINPIIHYMVPKEWNMPFDFVDLWALEGVRFNFTGGATKESGDIFFPLDIMFGKMLNKSTVFSLEFQTPIYKDDTFDLYDWKLGVRFGYFF